VALRQAGSPAPAVFLPEQIRSATHNSLLKQVLIDSHPLWYSNLQEFPLPHVPGGIGARARCRPCWEGATGWGNSPVPRVCAEHQRKGKQAVAYHKRSPRFVLGRPSEITLEQSIGFLLGSFGVVTHGRYHTIRIAMPPSTGTSAPVMKSFSASAASAQATSSGLPSRCRGMRFATLLRTCSGVR